MKLKALTVRWIMHDTLCRRLSQLTCTIARQNETISGLQSQLSNVLVYPDLTDGSHRSETLKAELRQGRAPVESNSQNHPEMDL